MIYSSITCGLKTLIIQRLKFFDKNKDKSPNFKGYLSTFDRVINRLLRTSSKPLMLIQVHAF